MKALMYRGARDIRYESIPDAALADSRGAIVKTRLCSICGTDLHPYHVESRVKDYCIGHEAIGEIVEIGADVANFRVGDRVLIPASLGCGTCGECLSGNVALCRNFRSMKAYGTGVPGVGGCQAEAVSVTAADTNLFHLPDDISDEVGIMLTDNLATAWYCARRGKISPGDTVAVIGLGSVGLQCVMAALAMGAGRVFAIDLLPDRRAAAAELGAHPIEESDVLGAVRELTDGRGVDAALDASGGAVTTPLAVSLARRGGRVSVIGVSEQPTIPFPILACLSKNIEFYAGVCSVQAELPTLIEALGASRLDPARIGALITHRMKLSEGSRAYALFDQRPDGLKKIVLDPTA